MKTPITDVLKQYVRSHKLPYRLKKKDRWDAKLFGDASMKTLGRRLLGTFPVHFVVREKERSLAIETLLPIHATVECHKEIAKLVSRLNVGRDDGSFSLPDTASSVEIVYTTEVHFLLTEPTVDAIHESVQANLAVAEVWLSAFALIIYAGMSAEEVVSLIPLGPHDRCDRFWFCDAVDCHARCE